MQASVVIPTHNRREGLAGLLDDLRRQDDTDAEVLVIDSPAGEDIGDVVAAAAAAGLMVRRILTRNTLAHKRNEGAAHAQGEVVCFLDDDMRVPPGWLAAHLAAHAEHPGSCVSGDVRFPEDWVRTSNYYRYKQGQHRNAGEADGIVNVPGNRVVAMNLSMPRELWESVGGNDEDFTRYGGEDVEFGFRVARAGIPTLFSPAAWAWHREVRLDVVGFCAKLYNAAYEGAPLVIAKAPEARGVRTFRWTEPGMQRGAADRVVHAALRAAARPKVAAGMAGVLRRSDGRRRAYHAAPYQALTLLVNQLAVADRVAGRPNRARELFR